MIYAIHEIESGRLVRVTTDAAKVAAPAILAARGYAVAERPDSEAGGVWNPATLAFDPPPPAPLVLTPLQWLMRFTPAERIAIRAARVTDPVVEDIMDLLDKAQEVHPAEPATVQGVQYLVSVGLLTPARGAEVLA